MYWHVKVKSSGLLRESDAGQISKSIEMEGGLSSSPNMGEMWDLYHNYSFVEYVVIQLVKLNSL
jgi:hypothetical protein